MDSHRARLRIATVLSALILSGCSFLGPPPTPSTPGDGIYLDLTDDVSVANLLLLTRGQGHEGHLLGAVVNNSGHDVEVTIVLADDGPRYSFDVPAQSMVNFTDAGLTPASVDVIPGATLPATVSSPRTGAFQVHIPVLDGTLPHYDRYLDNH